MGSSDEEQDDAGGQAWKSVEMDDAFLLGCTEAGFMGLEVLDSGGDRSSLTAGVSEDQLLKKAQKNAAKKLRREARNAQKEQELAAAAEELENELARESPPPADAPPPATPVRAAAATPASDPGRKLNRKEKKRAREAAAEEASPRSKRQKDAEGRAAAAAEEAAWRRVDLTAWEQMGLHEDILRAIAKLGFEQPTPIQEECIPAAVRDGRDIIGAAQTGSGKTLAFGIPLMQRLLAAKAEREAQVPPPPKKLLALVLTPTRELALQVCDHITALAKECGLYVAPIVGGLAAPKQRRLLSKCPEVVVATPGRLWDLIGQGEAHLQDLTGLRAFVLDEADRMVQDGQFKELESIFALIPRYCAAAERKEESEREAAASAVEARRQKRAAAKERRAAAAEHRAKRERAAAAEASESGSGGSDPEDAAAGSSTSGEEGPSEGEGDELMDITGQGEPEGGSGGSKDDSGSSDDEAQQLEEPSDDPGGSESEETDEEDDMQTLVFSATLMVPMSMRKALTRGKRGPKFSGSLDGLMDRLELRGKPKLIDLTTGNKLAERVQSHFIRCLEEKRDETLYYLLARNTGRTIVFVNAISAVRRVASLLKLLDLPCFPIHAQQQQRQRLASLDRFKAHASGVLVATDVAARGLDVRGVSCVLHYQLPASSDSFVHRIGRTARAGAAGRSVAMVIPPEMRHFRALYGSLDLPVPEELPLAADLMEQVTERIGVALRLDVVAHRLRKQKADRDWASKQSEELGYAPEAENDAEEAYEGTRVQDDAKVEKDLRRKLTALLATPLGAARRGKYFTGDKGALERVVRGGKGVRQTQTAGAASRGGQGATGEAGSKKARAEAARATQAATVAAKAAKAASGSLAAQRAAALQKILDKKLQKVAARGGKHRRNKFGRSSGKK